MTRRYARTRIHLACSVRAGMDIWLGISREDKTLFVSLSAGRRKGRSRVVGNEGLSEGVFEGVNFHSRFTFRWCH